MRGRIALQKHLVRNPRESARLLRARVPSKLFEELVSTIRPQWHRLLQMAQTPLRWLRAAEHRAIHAINLLHRQKTVRVADAIAKGSEPFVIIGAIEIGRAHV